MNNLIKCSVAAGLSLLASACATSPAVEMVDPRSDRGEAVVGLDYRDFEKAASDAVQSLLASGAVHNPNGGRYVMMVSRITNDTMQRIDTDQLIKKIRIDLLNSGRVVVTTAVAAGGAEDQANFDVREGLRGNEEFNQARVQRKGTLQAPDLSLSGKILQRNLRTPSGKQQIEYYFQLTMTDLASGLATWENELPIIKRASNASVAW